MTAKEVVALATAALAMIEKMIKYVDQLQDLAAELGASDDELADIDAGLTKAIERREAS